ncbi:MAG: winged helix-turn-helix domain-containing protein [Planctomycetia bacterium]|nr:winged helix-turn-helix domain-containing protein [Planctomycetia bacterium]
MASASEVCSVAAIGETAGAIWRTLSDQGPLSTAKLIKEVDAPRDVVMQALGWLAREDKIDIDDSRSKTVSLR